MIHPAILLSSLVTMTITGATQIPQWQPHDFEFRSRTQHANPFMVRFEASIQGPNGTTLAIPGFYDGDGTWKIRFAPTAPGKWYLTTSSEDPELDGKTIDNIECVPQTNLAVHGRLRVDPDHPRHFIFEDGSRFYMMGYECDWLWALDSTNPALPVTNAFLDKLTDHGFNYIILNVYAHDTNWKQGHTEVRDYGPPPVYPWLGTNEQPQQDKLNLDFWRHYDQMMDAMNQRGIIAHIMTKVYNKQVNWPKPLSPEEDLYYRTLIARYSAYPNVVWDFSKEAHGEGNFEYKSGRIKWIKDNDPYKHLVTVHDDSALYDAGAYANILDYRSDQQHSDWYKTVLQQRAQQEWPVVNVEFGYEWGPGGEGDATYPVIQSPTDVLWRAYEICLAGGYTAYYYTYTAWDIIHTEHTPPGYAYFRNLKNFFTGTKYWLMEPDDSLISKGHCLANPGKEYVVFQGLPGEYTLKIAGAESELIGEWYNPQTSERQSAGKFGNGVHKVSAPDGWNLMSLLHISEP